MLIGGAVTASYAAKSLLPFITISVTKSPFIATSVSLRAIPSSNAVVLCYDCLFMYFIAVQLSAASCADIPGCLDGSLCVQKMESHPG